MKSCIGGFVYYRLLCMGYFKIIVAASEETSVLKVPKIIDRITAIYFINSKFTLRSVWVYFNSLRAHFTWQMFSY